MKRPTTKLRRSLEVAANVAILIVAVIVIARLIAATRKPKEVPLAPAIGAKLSLAGVKWEDGRTLLMVLQKGCRYCEESVSFYHQLYEQRAGRAEPRFMALVPGERAETERYLSDHSVRVDDIISASLTDVQVAATPTLLLIDRSGRVEKAWVGKLNESQEKEVTQRVFDPH